MPKVIYTEAKGLIQKTGSGFPFLDFATLNRTGFDGTAANILDAAADQIGTDGATGDNATQILAATLNPSALNTTTYDGGAAGGMFLPAAEAGVHLALILNTALGGASALRIEAQGSAAEAARVAAGGTLATFAKNTAALENAVGVNEFGVEVADSHVELVLNVSNASNSAIDTGTVIHFYCPEDGKWLFRINNVPDGTGTLGAAAFATA